MQLFEFVAIIVVASLLAGLIKTWINTRASTPDTQIFTEEQQQLREQVAQLLERVKVLEAIVTDSKFDLNREIESLKQ